MTPEPAPQRPTENRIFSLILPVGDIIALLLFMSLGQRDHNTVDPVHPVLGLLVLTAEFVLPWIVAGWLLGAFPRRKVPGRGTFLARSLNAWLVAAPLGLLLRAFVLSRAVIPTLFMVVTVGLGGMFVIGWRLIFFEVRRAAGRRSGPA
ncbi:MAG: DUF3054 domain-containing protein [Anaerolineae bacterium]